MYYVCICINKIYNAYTYLMDLITGNKQHNTDIKRTKKFEISIKSTYNMLKVKNTM